jgi:integrase
MSETIDTDAKAKATETIDTDVKIRKAKPNGQRQERALGGGLYLVIEALKPNGRGGLKRFTSRGRKKGGAQVNYPLGEWSETGDGKTTLTLKQAIAANAVARDAFRSGKDLAAEARAQRQPETDTKTETLRAVVDEYERREGHKQRGWEMRRKKLELYVMPPKPEGAAAVGWDPLWGDVPFRSIKRSTIIEMLYKVRDDVDARTKERGRGGSGGKWDGQASSRIVFAVLSRIFNWYAVSHDDYASPIVRGMWDTASRKRQRWLSRAEVRAVWLACEDQGIYGQLIRFLLLTGARLNEAAEMTWAEYNPKTGVWLLPAARNKISTPDEPRDVVRPLNARARKILDDMPRTGEYVFAYDDHPISNWTQRLNRLRIASAVLDWSAHDCRRTMRTHMEGAPPEGCGVSERVAEECLGHKLGGMKGVYNCWSYEREKRKAYERWDKLLDEILAPPPQLERPQALLPPPKPKRPMPPSIAQWRGAK